MAVGQTAKTAMDRRRTEKTFPSTIYRFRMSSEVMISRYSDGHDGSSSRRMGGSLGQVSRDWRRKIAEKEENLQAIM